MARVRQHVATRDDLLDLPLDASADEYAPAAPTGNRLADLVGVGQQVRRSSAESIVALARSFAQYEITQHEMAQPGGDGGDLIEAQATYLRHVAADGRHPRPAEALPDPATATARPTVSRRSSAACSGLLFPPVSDPPPPGGPGRIPRS